MAIMITSKKGSESSKYSISGAQLGTSSAGRLCRYNCLIERRAPNELLIIAANKYPLKTPMLF
jgi:hypothetical protein